MGLNQKVSRLIVIAVTAIALSVVACGTQGEVSVVGNEPAAAAEAGTEHRLAGLSADAADQWSTTEANNRLVGLSADAADQWSTQTGAEDRLDGLSADAAEAWATAR